MVQRYVGYSNGTRFTKSYNAKASLKPTPFTDALRKYGRGGFHLTVLAVVLPIKHVYEPVETFFITLFETSFNVTRVSGCAASNVWPAGYEPSPKVLAPAKIEAMRLTALANLPRTGSGPQNPFYGMQHTPQSKLAMSIAKGTPLTAYELGPNGDSVLIGTYTSARAAEAALAGAGYAITRPTVLKYLKSGLVFCCPTGQQLYFKAV